ncbi:MAG: dockerin type I domain-containing protein [Planctomycetaceae bacterium]
MLAFSHQLSACPPDAPVQRATSGPYSSVWDHRITNSPGQESQGYDPPGGKYASLALSDNGLIAVGYERPDPENEGGNALSIQRFNIDFSLPGECVCDLNDECPLRLDDVPTDGTQFSHLSLAIAREGADQFFAGQLFAAWLSKPPGQTPSRVMLDAPYFLRETPVPDTILFSHSYFGPAPASSGGNDDYGPSAAIQQTRESVGLTSRLRTPATERRGLIHESQVSGSVAEDRFRCCDDGASCPDAPLETCAVQFQEWLPCAKARRTDGLTCVVWSERELANEADSPFNIALRLYAPDGLLLAQIDRDGPSYQSVNQPSLEQSESNQTSPAVDIDACGNIIIVWLGPDGLDTSICGASAGGIRVFGRRLAYENGTLFFRDNQFVVNVDPDWQVGPDPDLVNPSVALHLTPDPGFAGNFFIAWNAERTFTEPTVTQKGVRGRLFKSNLFRTPEFDVSPNAPDGIDRTLAESAQHTIAYWSKDMALAAWTEHDDTATVTDHVWYSAFDTGFAFNFEIPTFCIKGDVNADAAVDPSDIIPFIDYLLTEQIICDAFNQVRCAVDTNFDGETDGRDIQCFVNILTAGSVGGCNLGLATDCGDELLLEGEEEGGGDGMMAGGGQGQSMGGEGGGESDGMSDGGYPDPLAGLTQEEIEARWNAVIDFLDAHPRENYPNLTDEEHCAMCDEAYYDIMYEGIDLD